MTYSCFKKHPATNCQAYLLHKSICSMLSGGAVKRRESYWELSVQNNQCFYFTSYTALPIDLPDTCSQYVDLRLQSYIQFRGRKNHWMQCTSEHTCGGLHSESLEQRIDHQLHLLLGQGGEPTSLGSPALFCPVSISLVASLALSICFVLSTITHKQR